TGLGGAGAATAVGSQLGGASDPSVNPINSDANANYSDAAMPGYDSPGATLPPETWQDIATRYGGNVLQWATENPQLAAGLLGGVAGFLGNKDDFTSTQTTTNTIDPAIAQYRDHVLGNLRTFGDPNNVPAVPT